MDVELKLADIAARLEAIEETIIMRFIDRAQFAVNRPAYEPGMSGFEGGGNESLFELRLWEQEQMDARFGRYEVPEERPVSADLPAPSRRVHLPPLPLAVTDFSIVSRSTSIRDAYLALLTDLCVKGDDGQYGSAVEHDVYAIQAICRRVHYGALYVAEAKYRSNPQSYRDAARNNETERLYTMLTRPEVEKQIVARLERKVIDIQADVNTAIRRRIDPDTVVTFYSKTIIPLTKEGQVAYLKARAAVP